MKKTRRSVRRRRKQQRVLLLAGIAVGVCLLIFLAVYLTLRAQVNKVPADAICENVYIDEVDVSGMTAKKAEAAVKEQLADYQVTTVKLSAEEVSAEVSLKDLGFSVKDIDKLVKQAISYGKSGSVWKRYGEMKALKEEKKVIPVTYEVNDKAIADTIEKKMPHLDGEAKNATIVRKDGAFVITDEAEGVMIDSTESAQVIRDFFQKKWKKDGGTIALVTKVDVPRIKRADLETIGDLLGTFTTNCGYGGGRVQNIKSGAAHINGALLMPGEEYSANAAMEPYTVENGFAEAGSYENGKVVQSMGGGICQVSSTLYNAVILSELEIVERAAHSMLVSYVKPSMDAAIAGDFKDLKFKNNQATPIYIEGYVSGGNITFNIYGKETRPANRRVAFEHEVVSTTPAGKKFEASQDAIGVLKKASSGYDQMKANLWKIVYENDVEVSRKVANNSSYKSSPAIYHVGIASDHAEAAAVVNNAIASQDEATIQAAIAQAQQMIAAAQAAAVQTPPPATPEG
ncbi:MAG: VanW family protein [Faecalimonas sp.]|nr:VanW family protein [Faecalimonas sp.]